MIQKTYKVAVDYSKTTEELVKEGKYDWVNDNITNKNFRKSGEGVKEIEITIFNFKRSVTSEEVEKKLKDEGYRLANIKELLSLVSRHPDLQFKYPIISLGSKWRDPAGHVFVPYLSSRESFRGLSLISLEGDWDSGWRFAGVRKLDSSNPEPLKTKKIEPFDSLTLINKKLDKIIKFFSIK